MAALTPSLALRSLALVCFICACGQAQGQAQSADFRQEFVKSLTLRADRIVADSTHPAILWLAQTSAVSYKAAGPVKLTLSLFPQAADGKSIKDLGTFEVVLRDMVQRPFPVSAEMDGVPDGSYRIVGTLSDGDATVATLEVAIRLVEGIDAKRFDIERRLAKIEGHESTKATIRYPFDLARVINIGRMNLSEFDLGIDESRQPNWPKFGEMVRRSEELLSSLEKGTDPLWRAKGDIKRNYYFAEAGEIMPYRLYVPTTWDGKAALPFVLILHGTTRDQDFYFDRDNRLIPKLAEKYGFLLASVRGYHPNGGYNSGMLLRLDNPNGAPANGAAGGGAGPGGAGRGGASQFANGMSRGRMGELSEADTMHVFDLVKAEYPTDPKRTFLFGYSAGGQGGYYIGAKYAQNWAAVALGGASTGPSGFPFERVKDIPFHVFFGEQDGANVRTNSRAMVAAMKEHGMKAEVVEYKGATHDTAPAAGVGDVFEFFNSKSSAVEK